MRVLIGIPSRNENVEKRQACRETWLSSCEVPFLFFLSGISSTSSDEVSLNCVDDYLSHKVQIICRFALDRGYDYLFKCDDDTYVNTFRLLESGFEGNDWVGRNCGHYTQGGAGYWVSRKALEILANAPKSEWRSEDRWVGRTLLAAGLKITHDERYCNKGLVPIPHFNDIITAHPCTPEKLHTIDLMFRTPSVS